MLLCQQPVTVNGCVRTSGPSWIPDAVWYQGHVRGDGLTLAFTPGTLTPDRWIRWDALLDAPEAVKFRMLLQEGNDGPAFSFTFVLLPMAQARVRIPLSATDLNRWLFEREGAYVKPMAGGARVDLAKVDRLSLCIELKGDGPVKWCMTPVQADGDAPRLPGDPLLPAGVLLDEFGQSALRSWPGKSRSRQEINARLTSQLEHSASCRWPGSFSRWGGWKELRFDAAGFFRTRHDGKRWWLVDPDGHPFWSAGVDCVRVDTAANCQGLEKALTDPSEADAGLPASGIGRVAGQADRGRAYLVYCEDAASQPWCVGVHWFTLYDQSALGRFDGECYNIGFLDVCNRPYEELCSAARKSHESLYALASGAQQPFSEEPRYLEPLFF